VEAPELSTARSKLGGSLDAIIDQDTGLENSTACLRILGFSLASRSVNSAAVSRYQETFVNLGQEVRCSLARVRLTTFEARVASVPSHNQFANL
jgi:hypothetical protein